MSCNDIIAIATAYVPSAINNETWPGMSESESQVSASNDHLIPEDGATSKTSNKAQYFENMQENCSR